MLPHQIGTTAQDVISADENVSSTEPLLTDDELIHVVMNDENVDDCDDGVFDPICPKVSDVRDTLPVLQEDRLVWNYSKDELTNIRKSLSQINWNNALKDLNVNNQVEYFTLFKLNIFSIFFPNKTIAGRDRNPLWISDEVKQECHNLLKLHQKWLFCC